MYSIRRTNPVVNTQADKIRMKVQMEAKKQDALKGYLDSVEKYGENHGITQLKKNIMKMYYMISQYKEITESIADMFGAMNELNQSINDMTNISSLNSSPKVAKLPLWLQRIIQPIMRRRAINQRKRQFYSVMSNIKTINTQFEMMNDLLADMNEVFAQLNFDIDTTSAKRNKKRKKKGKTEEVANKPEIINDPVLAADLARAREQRGMIDKKETADSKTAASADIEQNESTSSGDSSGSDMLF